MAGCERPRDDTFCRMNEERLRLRGELGPIGTVWSGVNGPARALRAQHPRGWTSSTRRDLFEAQGGRCFYCEAELEPAFHVDHVLPLGPYLRRAHVIENLVATCGTCNLTKNDADPLEWAGVHYPERLAAVAELVAGVPELEAAA